MTVWSSSSIECLLVKSCIHSIVESWYCTPMQWPSKDHALDVPYNRMAGNHRRNHTAIVAEWYFFCASPLATQNYYYRCIYLIHFLTVWIVAIMIRALVFLVDLAKKKTYFIRLTFELHGMQFYELTRWWIIRNYFQHLQQSDLGIPNILMIPCVLHDIWALGVTRLIIFSLGVVVEVPIVVEMSFVISQFRHMYIS